MGLCTEQQRHWGQRNSETFLESREALQVWIYWEDSKKTATCPCTTSHHTIVMTLFPFCQVMARSSLVPLAGAVSGCVDPSHKATRKTNLCDLFQSPQPLCLMNKKEVWCFVSPPLVYAGIANASFTKPCELQGRALGSVPCRTFFCTLLCELQGSCIWGGWWALQKPWRGSATGFPVLSAGFFQVSKMSNGSFLPVSTGFSLPVHKVEDLSEDC